MTSRNIVWNGRLAAGLAVALAPAALAHWVKGSAACHQVRHGDLPVSPA